MNPVIAALIAGAVCPVLGVGVGMILRKMLAESRSGRQKSKPNGCVRKPKLRERAKDMVARRAEAGGNAEEGSRSGGTGGRTQAQE